MWNDRFHLQKVSFYVWSSHFSTLIFHQCFIWMPLHRRPVICQNGFSGFFLLSLSLRCWASWRKLRTTNNKHTHFLCLVAEQAQIFRTTKTTENISPANKPLELLVGVCASIARAMNVHFQNLYTERVKKFISALFEFWLNQFIHLYSVTTHNITYACVVSKL